MERDTGSRGPGTRQREREEAGETEMDASEDAWRRSCHGRAVKGAWPGGQGRGGGPWRAAMKMPGRPGPQKVKTPSFANSTTLLPLSSSPLPLGHRVIPLGFGKTESSRLCKFKASPNRLSHPGGNHGSTQPSSQVGKSHFFSHSPCPGGTRGEDSSPRTRLWPL